MMLLLLLCCFVTPYLAVHKGDQKADRQYAVPHDVLQYRERTNERYFNDRANRRAQYETPNFERNDYRVPLKYMKKFDAPRPTGRDAPRPTGRDAQRPTQRDAPRPTQRDAPRPKSDAQQLDYAVPENHKQDFLAKRQRDYYLFKTVDQRKDTIPESLQRQRQRDARLTKKDFEAREDVIPESLQRERQNDMRAMKKDFEVRDEVIPESLQRERQRYERLTKKDFEVRDDVIPESLQRQRQKDARLTKKDFEVRDDVIPESLQRQRQKDALLTKKDFEAREDVIPESLQSEWQKDARAMRKDFEVRDDVIPESLQRERQRDERLTKKYFEVRDDVIPESLQRQRQKDARLTKKDFEAREYVIPESLQRERQKDARAMRKDFEVRDDVIPESLQRKRQRDERLTKKDFEATEDVIPESLQRERQKDARFTKKDFEAREDGIPQLPKVSEKVDKEDSPKLVIEKVDTKDVPLEKSSTKVIKLEDYEEKIDEKIPVMKYADNAKFKYENLFSDTKENFKPEVQQPVELAKDTLKRSEIIEKPKQEDTKTTVVIKSPVISDARDLKLLDKETQADKPIVNTHEDSLEKKTNEDSKVIKDEPEEETPPQGRRDSITNKDYLRRGQALFERQPKQDIRYERRNPHDNQNRFETRDEYFRRSQLSQPGAEETAPPGRRDSITNKDDLRRGQALFERQPKQDIPYERRNPHDNQNRFETRDEYLRRSAYQPRYDTYRNNGGRQRAEYQPRTVI